MMPWKLLGDYSSYIFGWLVGYSGLLGPIAGTMIADYFLVRQTRAECRDLYRRGGEYEYRGGFNPRAIVSLALGIAVALLGLVIPPLRWLYDYAWFVGFAVSAATYVLFMRKAWSAQRACLKNRCLESSLPTKGLAEHWPPLSAHEALMEANRCLYCYDAPCTHACPTHIDIPRFIKKIATGNLAGSARAIFEANLLGATCARVCPVQELCEGACVLGADHKPIMIGRLQRYAMDHVYRRDGAMIAIAPCTGRSIAVVGSGPAGLSCAGELARRGHSVTIFERRKLAGGLSTYGIIALREPVEAALAEVAMIERLGVRIETGVELGRESRTRRSAPALRRCISERRTGRDARHGHSRRRADPRRPRIHRAEQARHRRDEDRAKRRGDRGGEHGHRLRDHRQAPAAPSM